MIITHTSAHTATIQRATTDDGRIVYSPMGDAVQIDGREVYCGNYLDQEGRKAGAVSAADRAALSALVKAVLAHNDRVAVELRNLAIEQQVAREHMSDADLTRNVRGFADGAR